MTTLDALQHLAAAAEEADGVAPLDEATWRLLRRHPDAVSLHVTADRPDAGVAAVHDGELALVVHPEHRGRGLGRALLATATDADAPTLAWSHADHPAARVLAASAGWDVVRELWVMRRPDVALPPVAVPDGVVVRGYEPSDRDELLRVNAAAFAHHPEQGSMDVDELAERMAEPWFDPAGLLVAAPADAPGQLLGFHWTKRHSAALGEVYVVGLAPEAQGRGLGGVLTLAGLHHLRDGGAREILLYVESDNAAAIAVYRRLGFEHHVRDTHVMYRRR
ncbi:mycothiol synthase [Nocardioides sp. TRM66260-LWL]|uniref:mycothiol synthase n=1 Tax=Nocardioides sp. TRM66260-LWL TaxID=2874478 RepID=UPI001CC5CEE4|nr:mycothiol synthase [Nocardioides sp. TRM66260-LWL]MBZ5734882.1 mycothiol synthase [Nocardioides sp. TRM66260-LWL]